jgi:bifunctional non-homologous end joining protein LigD
VNELATLLWAVNLGSIELHTSLHLRDDLHRPTAIAFDLDPGEGVGVLECGEVALRLRTLFEEMDREAFVKTSGSKGLQVYVPVREPVTYEETKPTSKAVAETLEGERPSAVVSRMKRSLRAGKVLVDWSQNTEHKSMVCAYSVRAKERPTVSTPIAWAELEDALDAGDPDRLVFEMAAVIERTHALGDLFEGLVPR